MASPREELVDEILRRHLAEGNEEIVSANKVARCASSPFALYCDLYAPDDQRDPDPESLVIRRERGYAHEEEVIEVETVPIPYKTLEEGFRLTVAMMAAGEPAIYQGLLVSKPAGMIGAPDQLVKVRNSKSIFGNYRYRVVEVKSHFNLTSSHKIQAAFYNRLLGCIQDLTPKTFVMINGRSEESVEKFNWWEGSLDRAIEDTRLIITRHYTPQPIFGNTPAPWRSFGNKLASSDLTRLWQIGGPRREALIDAGYYTLEDIAQASESDLSMVPKLDSYVVGLIVPQAKAILRNTPVFRRPVVLPSNNVEVFLDMENLNEGLDVLTGSQDGFFNYLTGIVMRSKIDDMYIPFFAETKTSVAEAECWRAFCEILSVTESPVIYYWGASSEKVYIRKMLDKYGDEHSVMHLLREAIDLFRMTTDAVAFPSGSYGLKDIADYLDFEWRVPNYDGLWAMIQYSSYLNSRDASVRNEILTYNEDDCRALMHVKDWLVENSL